jgi:hypothetical protein
MQIIQELPDGRSKIIEATGEIHFTEIEKPVDSGYRLFHYMPCALLTADDIENTLLPYFDVEAFTEYPSESDTIMPGLMMSHSLQGRILCERVARVHIAKNLQILPGMKHYV